MNAHRAHRDSRRRFLQCMGLAAAVPSVAQAMTGASSRAATHTVVTANIRVPLPEDETSGNGWIARRKLCADVIRSRRPDIVCLQEVLRQPLHDLLDLLNGYSSFGFDGPEMDARLQGYQLIAKNPILYATERYELVSAGGFWLSETPHLPATLSWGSARARHVNWVRLRDRKSPGEFRVLNTHLDHLSQTAREKQLRMILEEADTYDAAFPQVLAGDFNLDATNPSFPLFAEHGWKESLATASEGCANGFTAHAFQGTQRSSGTGRIDFIFTRGNVVPRVAAIVRDGKDGRFPSDHYFVFARVTLI